MKYERFASSLRSALAPDRWALGTERRPLRVVLAGAALLLASGLLIALSPIAFAQDADSPADLRQWLANRYAPSALVGVVASELGTPFDCVNRARQPGLRRANGSFAPIAAPPPAPDNNAPNAASVGEAMARIESVSCPAGTVPIAHVDLQTLLRFGSLRAFFAKHPAAASNANARVGSTATHQYAKVDQFAANWGGDAIFNLWNPYTELDTEFSLSQMWVVRGTGIDKQTLESGWQDYPNLYNSHSPKLFIYSTQDGYVNTGCYNGTCGDFVQYSATVAPTMGWLTHSSVNGPQYVIQLRWQRDNTNDNWWLMLGTQWVGYYPGTLFDVGSPGTELEFAL